MAARQGAERLAAALTLAKTFTLRAPSHDPDPTLAAGAVDPAIVLDDWSDAERNALLRRGVFAPSTYGRIRFHSRRTQEYLTASWLDRLLKTGCPRTVVLELVFAERYGIETIVPSLHATAAWLALRHPDICNEIARREPLVLVRHGDPRSLPLQAKEQLLFSYATHGATGEISDDIIDQQIAWLFATPDLAGAIHRSWTINNRSSFRMNLLSLIREGAIQGCVHLARDVVLDETSGDYLRINALEAISACNDTESLAEVTRWFRAASSRISIRLASRFAKTLFPRHLTVDELLDVIELSPARGPGSVEGFGLVTTSRSRSAQSFQFFEEPARLTQRCPDYVNWSWVAANQREISRTPSRPG